MYYYEVRCTNCGGLIEGYSNVTDARKCNCCHNEVVHLRQLIEWAEGWEDTISAIESEGKESQCARAITRSISTVIRNFREQFNIEKVSK